MKRSCYNHMNIGFAQAYAADHWYCGSFHVITRVKLPAYYTGITLTHILCNATFSVFFLFCSPHRKASSTGSCGPCSSDRWSGVLALPAACRSILSLPQPPGPCSWGGWGPPSPPPSRAQRRGPLHGPSFHYCWNNPERPHLRYDHVWLWIR